MTITKEESKYLQDKQTIKDNLLFIRENNGSEISLKAINVIPSSYERYKKEKEKVQKELSDEELSKKLKDIYEEIIIILKEYLDIPDNYYHLISLWIIGTYAHDSFNAFPYLFINAMRGSGKTRTLKLISSLASGSNGGVQTGINETTLFRTPKGVTLVLDECEGIGGKEKATLREYLNASYKKGMIVTRAKKVKTKEGDDFQLEEHEPYRPIAMANIWGMEEVLGDRCITLTLEKSNDPIFTKKIENFDFNYTIKKTNANFLCVQCSLCSVVTKKNMMQNWNDFVKFTYTTTHTTYTTLTTLTTLQPTISKEMKAFFEDIIDTEIDGRNLELFFPLFIISWIIDNNNFKDTLEIAKEMVKSRKDDEYTESRDVMLYDFVSKVNYETFDYVPIRDLTRQFKEFIGETDDIDDKWLTTKWMGKALKRLKLVVGKKRVARGIEVSLNITKAKKKIKMFKVKEE